MKHGFRRAGIAATIVSGAVALTASGALWAPAAVAGAGAHRRARARTVTVRVEGRARTLLAARSVPIPRHGVVGKDGHFCPADSGLGAFNEAVRGRWSGAWSASFGDFLVTRILGETDSYSTTGTYWSLYIDNVAASSGICAVKLHPGEQILWASVPDSATLYPLGFGRTSVHAGAGGRLLRITVRVLAYNGRGRARPLAGASVSERSQRRRSNAGGYATFTVSRPGSLRITASKPGYIRDEIVVHTGR